MHARSFPDQQEDSGPRPGTSFWATSSTCTSQSQEPPRGSAQPLTQNAARSCTPREGPAPSGSALPVTLTGEGTPGGVAWGLPSPKPLPQVPGNLDPWPQRSLPSGAGSAAGTDQSGGVDTAPAPRFPQKPAPASGTDRTRCAHDQKAF